MVTFVQGIYSCRLGTIYVSRVDSATKANCDNCDIAHVSIAEDCCVDRCLRGFLVFFCKMLTVQDKLHNTIYAVMLRLVDRRLRATARNLSGYVITGSRFRPRHFEMKQVCQPREFGF